MPVYKCPTHNRWVDSDREKGCPECMAAGGKQARSAEQRNRKPPVTSRAGRKAAPGRKRRWLLYVFLLALGASSLALPQVQDLLHEQGLGEVAERARQVSGEVEKVAGSVEERARNAAEELGVGELGEPKQEKLPGYALATETVELRTTHAGGGSGLMLLPPRNPREPRPLVVWLHGLGSTPDHGLDVLAALAQRWRFGVLAPAAHPKAGDAPHAWNVGSGKSLSDDERHVLDCMDELVDDPRFTIDAAHVMVVGAAGAGAAALHLATHRARFSHVAVLHEVPELSNLGPLKPVMFLSAGGSKAGAVDQKATQLRGLGYALHRLPPVEGTGASAKAVEAIVPLWLSGS